MANRITCFYHAPQRYADEGDDYRNVAQQLANSLQMRWYRCDDDQRFGYRLMPYTDETPAPEKKRTVFSDVLGFAVIVPDVEEIAEQNRTFPVRVGKI